MRWIFSKSWEFLWIFGVGGGGLGSLGILSEFFENSLGVLGFLNMKGIDLGVNVRKKEEQEI